MKAVEAPGQGPTVRPGTGGERSFHETRQTARETVRAGSPGIDSRMETHRTGTVNHDERTVILRDGVRQVLPLQLQRFVECLARAAALRPRRCSVSAEEC